MTAEQEKKPYPFETRHPDATAGMLPAETRKVMLELGWIHESEVSAISNTKYTGRKRWQMPSAVIGNEIYYRIEDIAARLENSYNEHASKLATKARDAARASGAIA